MEHRRAFSRRVRTGEPFERIVHHVIDLLSAPLTISLIYCHIHSIQRASRCGEARARRRKEEMRAGIASRGM
jgi:hypothetical protein